MPARACDALQADSLLGVGALDAAINPVAHNVFPRLPTANDIGGLRCRPGDAGLERRRGKPLTHKNFIEELSSAIVVHRGS